MKMLATTTGYKVSLRDSVEDRVLFIADILKKEVNQGNSIKKVKQLKKMFKKFVTLFGVKMGMTTKAFALAVPVVAPVASQTITPAVILHWGFMLATLTVSIGLAISMSLLGVAGIYRMFRRRDEATEWSTDIIKGLVQTLVAVPIVYVIFTLAQHLFKALPSISGLSF